MPKIPKHLQEAPKPIRDPNKKPPCVACGGTGKNSRGSRCVPCNGAGVPYVWVCPYCKREHHGFGNASCRNEKCPGKRLRTK